MARCGCASATTCSCQFAAGNGITLSGTGGAGNPLTISGRLSRDAGNGMSFGSDGGLYADTGGGSGETGGVTVAGLPATGVLGGYRGAGSWVMIGNQYRSMKAARDLPLDLVHMDVWALLEGVPVLSSASAMPAGQAKLSATAASYSRQQWQTQTPRVVTTSGQAPTQVPDGWSYQWLPSVGGHGTWAEDTHGGATYSEVTAEIGRQIVMVPQIHDQRAVNGVLRDLRRFGTRQSTIVVAKSTSWLTPFLDENVACGVVLDGPGDATDNPPTAVVNAGMTWVVADQRIDDATLTAYRDAGLQVLGKRANYHFQRARLVDNLGLRGILSDDPIYASGRTDLYRRTGWPYQIVEDSCPPPYGLSAWDMDQDPDNNVTAKVRGEAIVYDSDQTPSGIRLPAGTGPWDHALNAGWVCPVFDGDGTDLTYDVRVKIRFASEPSSTTRWLGVSVCNPDDQPWDHDEALPNSRFVYLATYRFNGEVELFHMGGLGSATGTWHNGNADVKVAYETRVRVTPTAVQVLDPDSETVICQVVNGDDATQNPRGAYITLNKHAGKDPSGNPYPFDGEFSNLRIEGP